MSKYRPTPRPLYPAKAIPVHTKLLSFNDFVTVFPQKRTDFLHEACSSVPYSLYLRLQFLASDLSYLPCTQKMGTMLKQVQTQKQQHTILPQQIELLNLFH